MTSFECQPLSLSSTICSCLCCFFVVYKPARVAMQYAKSPQVILALWSRVLLYEFISSTNGWLCIRSRRTRKRKKNN